MYIPNICLMYTHYPTAAAAALEHFVIVVDVFKISCFFLLRVILLLCNNILIGSAHLIHFKPYRNLFSSLPRLFYIS